MNGETIILEKKENIAKITLNRPDKLNAIDVGTFRKLLSALADVNDDDEMRVLVITGAGRGFCAGADVSRVAGGAESGGSPDRGADTSRGGVRERFTSISLGLQKMRKPTIAMVNGVAAGAGVDLALACDLRVGSENARFVNGFVRRGLVPGDGGCWLYPRVMGMTKALEYLFTGDPIEAKDAERIGILNYLVPAEELEKETMSLARKIANGPPIAIRLAKLLLYQGLGMDLETAQHFAAACQLVVGGSEDAREGTRALLERRQAIFKGK